MIIVQLAMYGVFFGLLFKTSGIGAGLSDRKEKDAKSDVKFSDVAGLEEVKEDLMTVVDFLKNPDEYKDCLLYTSKNVGKPCEGEPHARFDKGRMKISSAYSTGKNLAYLVYKK